MKKVSVMVLMLMLAVSGFAQGRGQGQGPAASRGPGAVTRPENRPEPRRDVNVPERKEVERKEAERKDALKKAEQSERRDTRLSALLPTGVSLETASEGFKNDGQFIAALHVSKNLGIPFADLKAKMTGENPMSLGSSIQSLRPTLTEEEVTVEVKSAEREAKEERAVKEAREAREAREAKARETRETRR